MKRLALLVLLLGCDPAPTPGGKRIFTDWRGKAVGMEWPPKRIVSIIPSATEMLFAVGAAEQVVGVTAYCDYPSEAKAKEKVGALVIDGEKLVSLRPDVVVTSARLARQSTMDLEARGLAVFSVDPENFEDIAKALRVLGELTGHEAEGARAAEALLARVKSWPAGPTVYFEHSADPLGTTGPESYVGEAIRRAGGRNIFEGGWKMMVEWERVVAADPEVILITHDRREGLERRAGWKDLKAVKNGRVHFLSKEHFVYPTPRLVEGLEACARIFHAKNP